MGDWIGVVPVVSRVVPEELSRAVSLADECSTALGPVSVEPSSSVDIEQSVKDGKPVAASTSEGDFSKGDTVNAASDTNGDGKIDTEYPGSNGEEPDQTGDYRLVGGDYDNDPETDKASHAYTVVDIDDKYVTLRNPWGFNDTTLDRKVTA